MAAIDFGAARASGPLPRILQWLLRRRRHDEREDPLKLLDELNERLLRDIGYERERGLRRRHSAELWLGRTPPERP